MKSPYLSVVIPSFNEPEDWKSGVMDEVYGFLQKQPYSWEVIISDDGSSIPEAITLAKDYCAKHKNFIFLENEHGGKPFALWSGIQKAQGEIILLSDLDQSTPIGEITKLLPYYEQNFDVVIGSRGTGRKNTEAFRVLASFIFRTFRRIFLLPKVIDTQCGFKTLKKQVALEVFPKLSVIKKGKPKDNNWHVGAWDGEMLFVAEKYGYKIKEVPVEWENRDLSMETKKSTNKGKFIKESIEMVEEVLRVRYNNLTGYYNK